MNIQEFLLNAAMNPQGMQPTPGPAPQMPQEDVPRGTFDPLSKGASEAIQKVKESVGSRKPGIFSGIPGALSHAGRALMLTSQHPFVQAMGHYSPEAREEADIAENMKIMQFLQEAEKARQQQMLNQLEFSEKQKHNRALEQYYNRGTGAGVGGRKYAPTNLGKLHTERDQMAEVYGDDSPQVQSYDLAIQKATTDSDARRRSLLASNLEKSMDALDSGVITQYSGPRGIVKLRTEQAKDLAGNPSEDYLKYKEALVASEFETSELRQFFGDSITPEVRKHLQILSNPSSLSLSPEAAQRQVNKSRSIVRKQLETYRGALKGTKEHKGHGNQMVTIRNKATGESKQVTLEEAKSMGAR